MLRIPLIILLALALPEYVIDTAPLASTALAQQQTQPTPAPPAKEPAHVEEKGFKNKIFELKHRNPDALLTVLRPLGSGFKGAMMTPSSDFNTITVRDFPENIAVIEEAIKRLDVPDAPRPDIEFTIHVLIASNAASGANEYPTDLGDVVKQLQRTLSYKSYSLMTSAVHRAKVGRANVENSGVAESKLFSVNTPQGNPIFYNYRLAEISLDKETSGEPVVQIGSLNFGMRIPVVLGTSTSPNINHQNVGLSTAVSIQSGQKVVVGTTTMGDKGLIIVLTAKVLR
ncbi:MAG TPA: secretin N-terminal domain-containing protein [Blastocatellia bacterium]|nr:secretin N-terminal domain-containing protein [Blastocatellia bacterium]